MNFQQTLNMLGLPFDEKTTEEFSVYLANKQKEKKQMGAVGKISHEDVTSFVKLLVEAGNIFSVLGDNTVVNKKSSEPVTIQDTDGVVTQLKIYHDDRVPGNYITLNPFKEKSVLTPAQIWFEQDMEQKMRYLLVRCLEEIATAILENETTTLMNLQRIIKFGSDVVPPKTIREEIRKIEKDDVLYFTFDTKTKKGKLVSNLESTTAQEHYKSKVKAKSWQFIIDMVNAIFNITPANIQEVFTYNSTTHGAPYCEALIKIGYDWFEYLNPVCQILGLPTINMEEWKEHLRYIEKYQMLTKLDDGLRQTPLKVVEVPWSKETQQVTQQVVAPVAAPATQVATQVVAAPTAPATSLNGTGYPKAAEIVQSNIEAAKAASVMMYTPGIHPHMVHPTGMIPNTGVMMNTGVAPNMAYPYTQPNMVPGMPGTIPGMMPGMMPGTIPGMMPGMMPNVPNVMTPGMNMPGYPNMMMPNGIPSINPMLNPAYANMVMSGQIPGVNQHALVTRPTSLQ